MIHESLQSATTQLLCESYPVLRVAFEWIRNSSICVPTGIIELRGRDMYVNVHGYDTLPQAQCVWESHQYTVDVQYCISGGEIIEWQPTVELEPAGEYNLAKDAQKWRGGGGDYAQIRMYPGAYAIFLSHELHRPKILDGSNLSVRKLVIKIKEALLKEGQLK